MRVSLALTVTIPATDKPEAERGPSEPKRILVLRAGTLRLGSSPDEGNLILDALVLAPSSPVRSFLPSSSAEQDLRSSYCLFLIWQFLPVSLTMESLGVAQALAGMDLDPREDDLVDNVGLYPSSAVAQTHVPGSAQLGALQQPPPVPSQHHHRRTSAIFQNPSFDNKHSAYRTGSTGKTTAFFRSTDTQQGGKTQPVQQPQPSNTTISDNMSSTSAAMVVDDAARVTVTTVDAATNTSTDVVSNDATSEVKPATEATAPATEDAGTNSTVRKVR